MITRRGVLIGAGIGAVSEVRGTLAQTSAPAKELQMEIKRNGSQPSRKGPEDWFTGSVRVDPLFQAPEPARAGAGQVTFEPGARTAWHAHPLGQVLHVLDGVGRVQAEGGPVVEVRPGDTVTAGQHLLTLEAMKMESPVTAPVPGRVAAVHVAPGDQVSPGTVLLTLAPATTG